MRQLPKGTVTLVFTDIEGSTRLLTSLGSRYEAVLADHRKLLRDAFSSHHGVEVDTQGDAFFYAFGRAHDALAGARAAQRALASHPWPDDAELRVRIGIHTGEPTVTAEGYVGGDVHLGARICAATWGEQVLLSDATAHLIADNQDASLRDLGEHTLKDIDVPVRLHQVVAPGLRSDFPPPRTASSHPTNLPPTLEPLVGRAEYISELTSLLSLTEVRIVTLTGPGGVGKTRVSLTIGAELLHSFSEGVFFVDLSTLADPALVPGAIVGALGLRESPGRSLSETLADYLASRQVLLILDNLEHLLDAAADVSALVASAPSLKVLITSREPLRIAGEHEVPLAPLALPLSDADATEVAASAAVELFVTRARALRPGFELTAEEASSVAAICRRLDGLPLAIELAAARTKVLSLSALASRLDQSLAALGHGRRDASTRQRTLRGAIEWSYELLSPDEQILFRRLGVFAGGFTLEAAEAVCGRGDASVDVLGGLASLIDKSLVRAREHEDRFVMLETIRSFAGEELEASGEAEDIRRAHSDYFRGLAGEAERHLTGQDQKEWLDRLNDDRPNLRAALDWSVERMPEATLAAGASLWRFWRIRGGLGEGRRWLERSAAVFVERTPTRARGLRSLSIICNLQGDRASARAAAQEARVLFEELEDMEGFADALDVLASIAQEQGDLDRAVKEYRRVQKVYRDIGELRGVAVANSSLAEVALLQGRYDDALSLALETKEIYESQGDDEGHIIALLTEGFARLGQASIEASTAAFQRALSLSIELDHIEGVAIAFEGLAAAASHRDTSDEAARFLGMAATMREERGFVRQSVEDLFYRATVKTLRSTLGAGRFEESFNSGRQEATRLSKDESSLRLHSGDSSDAKKIQPDAHDPSLDRLA